MDENTVHGEEVAFNPLSREARKNFSWSLFVTQVMTQFNFTSVSLVLDLMTRDGWNVPSWASGTLDLTMYVGAILGMVSMGSIGDRIGLSAGMSVALALGACGAIGSGTFTWGSDDSDYMVISVFRFLCGFGIGGTYPLSAAAAAENAGGEIGDALRINIGWTYLGQAFGLVTPYLYLYLIWACNASYGFEWRSLLIFGGLPPCLILCMNLTTASTLKSPPKDTTARALTPSIRQLLTNREYLLTLVGTGGTWFLNDFVSYGIKMFSTTILEDIFNNGSSEESLQGVLLQNMLLNVIAVPAIIITIYALPRLGTRRTLLVSWPGQAFCFFAFVCAYYAGENRNTLMFECLCGIAFFRNFGCGCANFIASVEMYPRKVRSSFSGISAGIAKLGAISGIIVFTRLLSIEGGEVITMCMCGAVSVFATFATFVFIKDCNPDTKRVNHDSSIRVTVSVEDSLVEDSWLLDDMARRESARL